MKQWDIFKKYKSIKIHIGDMINLSDYFDISTIVTCVHGNTIYSIEDSVFEIIKKQDGMFIQYKI